MDIWDMKKTDLLRVAGQFDEETLMIGVTDCSWVI
jgi:hypothetical protein